MVREARKTPKHNSVEIQVKALFNTLLKENIVKYQ